jgi:hypothetical protein
VIYFNFYAYILMVQSTSVKFLGIFIDNKLKWNKHIEYLENKLIKVIRILNITKHKLDKQSLIKIYNSLVLSNITYCSEIWGSPNKTLLQKLRIPQNKIYKNYRKHFK